MPKLNEVVAGILRDLTQARVAADSISRDYFDLYQQDPVLSQIPVPRVSVREVTIKLRFAIEAHAPSGQPPPTRPILDRAWKKQLFDRTIPGLLKELGPKLTLDEASETKRALVAGLEAETFDLQPALESKETAVLGATEKGIVAGLKAAPGGVREKLGPIAAIRESVALALKRDLAAIAPQLRDIAAATRIVPLEMEALIARADLAAVPESAMQEVTLQIAMDDLRAAAPGEPPKPT